MKIALRFLKAGRDVVVDVSLVLVVVVVVVVDDFVAALRALGPPALPTEPSIRLVMTSSKL